MNILMKDNRERIILKSFYYLGSVGGGVNCGNHRASSCKDCPRGQGPTHCSGDCKWNWDSFSCEGIR